MSEETEDKLDAEIARMFDEVAEARVTPDGKVEAKPARSEAEEEMAEAIADLRHAWKRFRQAEHSHGEPALSPKRIGIEWWRAVDALGIADSRAKQAFCGRDRSPASIQQYHKWKLLWLTAIRGEWYKPDA